MWDTKIRELIDRLFIEANGNKSAFEEALREADIEFVSSESDIVAVPSKYEEENTVYNYFEDGGGFGATFRRSRTRFNDRAHRSRHPARPLGFDRHASIAGIALALRLMGWPFPRWALKLWFEGVFRCPLLRPKRSISVANRRNRPPRPHYPIHRTAAEKPI